MQKAIEDENSLTPEHEKRVRESFSGQPFMQHLGAQLSRVGPGYCEVHVPYRQELSQQHGYFHSGVAAAVADTACGYAAFTLLSKDTRDTSLITVEYKLSLLAPAVGDSLVTCAQVIRSGKTLTVCRADVFSLRAGTETLCATSLATFIALSDRGERPQA